MGKEKVTSVVPLRFSGYFDMDAIYKTVTSHLKKLGIKLAQSSYKHKKSGPGLFEVEIKIKGKVKLDEYHAWHAEVEFKTWDTQKAQDPNTGKQLYYGRFQMLINGEVETDWQDAYGGAPPLIAAMGRIVYKLRRDDKSLYQKDELRKHLYELQGKVKQILGVDTQ